MAEIATLSSTFRISIPKAVREHQHWKPGQKLVFIPRGNGVLLVPAPALNDLRGIAKGAYPEHTETATTATDAARRYLCLGRVTSADRQLGGRVGAPGGSIWTEKKMNEIRADAPFMRTGRICSSSSDDHRSSEYLARQAWI